MKISVITVLYNEEFLLPFFLSHYNWADEIRVLLDSDTTDRTPQICEADPKVIVKEFTFPDMMDAIIKQKHIHDLFYSLDCDWVIVADCDEFIFPIPWKDQREAFQQLNGDIATAHMWPVYRHESDGDLDPGLPAMWQRRHGDPDMNKGFNYAYIKPCIARPGTKVNWGLGCHNYHKKDGIIESDFMFYGAHWKMADPELAIIRRIVNGKDRQSKSNLSSGYQIVDHNIDEQQIRDECEKHLNDPRLF